MAYYPTNAYSVSQVYTASPATNVIPIIAAGTAGFLTGAHISISGQLGTTTVMTVSLTNANQSATFWSTYLNSSTLSGQTGYPYEVLLTGPYAQNIPFANGVAGVVQFTGANPNMHIVFNVTADLTAQMAGAAASRTSYLTINPQVVGTALDRKEGTPGRTEAIQRFAEVTANAMLGKLNVGGAVTLTGATTTLKDSRIGGQSLLLFMPLDNLGVEAVDSIYVTSRTKGQAILEHQNSTSTVEYIVIG